MPHHGPRLGPVWASSGLRLGSLDLVWAHRGTTEIIGIPSDLISDQAHQ